MLGKIYCPKTRLEGLIYSACVDWHADAKIPDKDINMALSTPHDGSIFTIKKDATIPTSCIEVVQKIDPGKDPVKQFRDGFSLLSKIKSTISIPLMQFDVTPIHDNTGFFVWDFRELKKGRNL